MDGLEKYFRRTNIQFQGIPDTANREDFEAKIMDIVNNQIGLTPPPETDEIVRCHRMGRTPNKRSMFHSECRRNVIIRMRGKLPCFYEDLTVRRYELAFHARTLRKKGKLTDTWTYSGKIIVKDLQNKIALITTKSDLDKY